jgi:hypothetical protein
MAENDNRPKIEFLATRRVPNEGFRAYKCGHESNRMERQVKPNGTPRGGQYCRRTEEDRQRKRGEESEDEINSGSWGYLGTVCGEDLERRRVERKEELSYVG